MPKKRGLDIEKQLWLFFILALVIGASLGFVVSTYTNQTAVGEALMRAKPTKELGVASQTNKGSDTTIQKVTQEVECLIGSVVGDANGDGKISPDDARIIHKIFYKEIERPENLCCVDTNGDGDLSPEDIMFVWNFFRGIGGTGNVGMNCGDIFTCEDSDGGQYPLIFGYTKGYKFGVWETHEDTCFEGNRISEKYCEEELNMSQGSIFNCTDYGRSFGCYNGQCVEQNYTCTETDSGNDPYNYGSISGYYQSEFEIMDTCVSPIVVYESYCTGDSSVYQRDAIDCSSLNPGDVCFNGECISPDDIHLQEYNVVPENNMRVFIVKKVTYTDQTLELSDFAIQGSKSTLDSMADFYRIWTNGSVNLNMGIIEVPEIRFDSEFHVFMPIDLPTIITEPYLSHNIDFYMVIMPGGNEGQGSGADYGLAGAGQAVAAVNDYCFSEGGSIMLNGQNVCEPIVHEPIHIMDIALNLIMGQPDIYQDLDACIDWETWDRCGNCEGECYPACNEGEEDTYLWFPSIDLCEWDPDWVDCNNEGEPHYCLKSERYPEYPEVGQTWYQHVLEDHFPRNITFIGNHCRDGIQNFGETSTDCGGPCSVFC